MKVQPQPPVKPVSPAKTYADGVSDRAAQFLYFPTDLTNYLLGADRKWGERRSFFKNAGTNYASWWDPFARVANVGYGFAGGIASLASVGLLHPYLECLREGLTLLHVPHANSILGRIISYTKPFPTTGYALGEWTFDVAAVVATGKAGMEYQAWSGPITQRTILMNEVMASRPLALKNWATALGGGNLEAAIPILAEKAMSIPEFSSKTLIAALMEGTQAMEALDMMSPRYPQVAQWLRNPRQSAFFARRIMDPHMDVVAAAQARLDILVKHNPNAVISAVIDSALKRYPIPKGEKGAGGIIDHAATPHFELLRRWEGVPGYRQQVMNAYGTIAMSSDSVPITTTAAEGVARLMPESDALVMELLTDRKPRTVYAMARALASGSPQLSPAMLARLKQLPLDDYSTIMWEERVPAPAMNLLQAAMREGNPSALPAMKVMVEIGHPFAYQVLVTLRQLRKALPTHDAEISTTLRTLDTSVIKNEVSFYVGEGKFELASDNATVLMELAKEGNVGAQKALLSLSKHTLADVYNLASERLVDLALAKAFTEGQVAAWFKDPQPRVLSMVEYWSVRDPATLPPEALQMYCDMVMRNGELSTEALHVLQTQARVGTPLAGRTISHIFERTGKYRNELLQLMQQYPNVRASVDWPLIARVAETMVEDIEFSFRLVRLMSEDAQTTASLLKAYDPRWFLGAAGAGAEEGVAGLELLARQGNRAAYAALKELAARPAGPREYFSPTFLARKALAEIPEEVKPTDATQLTISLTPKQAELQYARMAAIAEGELSGTRVVTTIADLTILQQGAELGTPGALDALYKIAGKGGVIAAEAHDFLLRMGNQPEVAHPRTIRVMLSVLDVRKGISPAASGEVSAPGAMPSLRYLENLMGQGGKYAAMGMDELMRQMGVAPDAAWPAMRRLMASPNPLMVDFVAERLVAGAAEGRVPVGFLEEVLSSGDSSMGLTALQRCLRFYLETASSESTLLEPLRPHL